MDVREALKHARVVVESALSGRCDLQLTQDGAWKILLPPVQKMRGPYRGSMEGYIDEKDAKALVFSKNFMLAALDALDVAYDVAEASQIGLTGGSRARSLMAKLEAFTEDIAKDMLAEYREAGRPYSVSLDIPEPSTDYGEQYERIFGKD